VIEIHIKIKERPAAVGRVGCQLDLQIESVKPANEEVHLAAMVLSKLRELGTEIAQQPGTTIRVVETEPPKN